MRNVRGFGWKTQILRLLVLVVILILLTPKLIAGIFSLYQALVQRDREPSGNPLRVEAPGTNPNRLQQFVIKLKP